MGSLWRLPWERNKRIPSKIDALNTDETPGYANGCWWWWWWWWWGMLLPKTHCQTSAELQTPATQSSALPSWTRIRRFAVDTFDCYWYHMKLIRWKNKIHSSASPQSLLKRPSHHLSIPPFCQVTPQQAKKKSSGSRGPNTGMGASNSLMRLERNQT